MSEAQSARPANLCRVDELVVRLTVGAVDAGLATEVCRAFDVAAEFAACEGVSIAKAVGEFFAEAEPKGTAWGDVQERMRMALGWGEARTESGGGPLPVMPSAAMKMLRMKDDTATVGQLEAVASSDPVLAGQVLRLANSAMFGSRFQITRLGEAIQRVGVPEARQALLASSLSGLFASKTLQDLWTHSQGVADLARLIAGMCGADEGAAYTAGLLHDIGRLAFLRGAGRLQAAEWNWMAAGFPMVYAETLVRGEDHAEKGAAVLTAWELPAELVDAVRLHHRPECSGDQLAYILFLAEDLATGLRGKPAEDLWGPMRRRLCLDKLGLEPEAILEAISMADERGRRRIC
jgi:putative nucleotidyltransferase with HDIG domain